MAQVKSVTLIAPDGNEVRVGTPTDVNSLVFGHGYKVKGHKGVDAALAHLADQATPTELATADTTTQVKPSK